MFRKHVYKYKYVILTHTPICVNIYLQSSCKRYSTILIQCYSERRGLRQDEAERRVTPAQVSEKYAQWAVLRDIDYSPLHAFAWASISHNVKIGLKSLEVTEKTF